MPRTTAITREAALFGVPPLGGPLQVVQTRSRRAGPRAERRSASTPVRGRHQPRQRQSIPPGCAESPSISH